MGRPQPSPPRVSMSATIGKTRKLTLAQECLPDARSRYLLGCYPVALAMGLLILWRHVLKAGGDHLLGLDYDSLFNRLIMEHNWAVWRGDASWLNPLYFYPEPGLLGYSDTLCLFSLPYCLIRAFGLGPIAASELTLVFWAVVGFALMACLLRRELGLSHVVAALGAFVFIAGSPPYQATVNGHLQLLSVWLFPAYALLGIRAVRHWQQRGELLSGWVFLLVLLFAAHLLNSVYMPWLLGLALGGPMLALGITLLAKGRLRLEASFRRQAFAWALLITVGLIALVPLFLVYGPTASQIEPRPLEQAVALTLNPVQFLVNDPHNLLWGWLVNEDAVSRHPLYPELRYGWGIAGSLLAAFAFALSVRRLTQQGHGNVADWLVLICGSGVLAGIILSVNIGG